MEVNGYTESEVKLITMFGYDNLCEHIDAPTVLYRMCVEQAFIKNMQGSHVEALRRGYAALLRCNPYRHTDEFENLIQFKD